MNTDISFEDEIPLEDTYHSEEEKRSQTKFRQGWSMRLLKDSVKEGSPSMKLRPKEY
jgi:hypothetical protein